MKVKSAIVLASAALMAACGTTQEPPSNAAAGLSGEEIRVLVSGNTVEGQLSDGHYFKAYHFPDGKVSAVSEKGGKSYRSTGTWTVKDNSACTKWDDPGWSAGCFVWQKSGDTYLIKPASLGGPTLAAAKLVPGNPYNL